VGQPDQPLIATAVAERRATLRELVRLADLAAFCGEVGDVDGEADAQRRLAEVVAVLGFDPIVYQPGRDYAARFVASTSRTLIRAMPGTTREIAAAAGCPPRDVRAHLLGHLDRGEVRFSKGPGFTLWEVPR